MCFFKYSVKYICGHTVLFNTCIDIFDGEEHKKFSLCPDCIKKPSFSTLQSIHNDLLAVQV